MTLDDLVLLHAPSVYDFRRRPILFGPVSDLIPSSPAFEMYPLGFVTLLQHLQAHGMRARIANLAVRMVRDAGFDVEGFLRRLRAKAFGIDLHWLPHAHGSLEVAALLKELHPGVPVIFGGFSASYYHEEILARYPAVDYVLRGEFTEEPLLLLLERLEEGRPVDDVPGLTWREDGNVRQTPLAPPPPSLDHLHFDYGAMVRTVLRRGELENYLPTQNWLDYPITVVITARGCFHACISCGGTNCSGTLSSARPVFRSPELVAEDLSTAAAYFRGPIFILGDLRQGGTSYAPRFLEELRRHRVGNRIVFELFRPASAEYLGELARSVEHFNLELSPETHDDEVRRLHGKPYRTEDYRRTVAAALEAGCERLDLFFMVGLRGQSSASALDSIAFVDGLLREHRGDPRIAPFISPLAPFLDPGSLAFEHPIRYGYRLFYRTLAEHREALLQPSWKYMLNYETRWMSRDEIVQTTYATARALNRVRARHGLSAPEEAERTEERILAAAQLSDELDWLLANEPVALASLEALQARLAGLSESTVCQKSWLRWPSAPIWRSVPRIALALLADA